MFSSNVHGSYFTCQRLAFFLAATKRKKGKKLIKTQYCMSRTFIAIESDAISFVVWWRAWVREYFFQIRYTSKKKKNYKISLDFLNQKNLRWNLSKNITVQYSIEHSKDEMMMMMMLQGLYYLSLYYVSILFWYSITHLFLSIFFFAFHSSMKTSTSTTKTATLQIFLLLLAKKRKRASEKGRMRSLQTIESVICQNEVHKSPQEYFSWAPDALFI